MYKYTVHIVLTPDEIDNYCTELTTDETDTIVSLNKTWNTPIFDDSYGVLYSHKTQNGKQKLSLQYSLYSATDNAVIHDTILITDISKPITITHGVTTYEFVIHSATAKRVEELTDFSYATQFFKAKPIKHWSNFVFYVKNDTIEITLSDPGIDPEDICHTFEYKRTTTI